MSLKDDISPNQHAYIIAGANRNTVGEINDAIEKVFGVKIAGNPDCRFDEYEVFGIDESRRLKEEQGFRPMRGEFKFFIISTDSITREAQNALLKVFEEPTEGTYIFLVVQSEKQIIPTLLSRVRVVKLIPSSRAKLATGQATNDQRPATGDAGIFLKTPVENRLNLPFVKKLIEDKEKQFIVLFFNELESVVRGNIQVSKMTKGHREFFTELLKCKNYVNDRSSSVKMLLEHVALITPVFT